MPEWSWLNVKHFWEMNGKWFLGGTARSSLSSTEAPRGHICFFASPDVGDWAGASAARRTVRLTLIGCSSERFDVWVKSKNKHRLGVIWLFHTPVTAKGIIYWFMTKITSCCCRTNINQESNTNLKAPEKTFFNSDVGDATWSHTQEPPFQKHFLFKYRHKQF